MARGLKFPIKEVEDLHFLCSENKAADQLLDYSAPDQCLCYTRPQTVFVGGYTVFMSVCPSDQPCVRNVLFP